MTLVIKIGGGAGVLTNNMLGEIAQLVRDGERVVVLHGGSDAANTLGERMGHPARMVTSPGGMVSRYTDAETLHIYAMAVAGDINTTLVASLQRIGVHALGLAGVDGRLLLARRKPFVRAVSADGRAHILRDDYTGQIEQVNNELLVMLLDAGYVPVIAPLALSSEGERLNVDGDRAAAAVASSLRAGTLVIMTNVRGLLADPADDTTLIRAIPGRSLDEYMVYARGRMRKKLLGAQEALQGGVGRVCIGSASVLDVLHGAGTTIVRAGDEAIAGTLSNERNW